MSQNNLSSDERWLAALSHAAVLFPTLGLFAPLIVWVTRREKSDFLRFQSLQALTYQVILLLVWVVLGVLLGLLFTAISLTTAIVALYLQSQTPFIILSISEFVFFAFLLVLMGLGVVLGIIAAIACLNGSHFRYPLLGGWLEKLLHRSSKKEEVQHD
uniref:DUF4870 domain-containing protein n=1 Tax=Bellilinea caldifistulae TaxID=360411 RepID=A0A7C4Q316_9CHLR